MRAVTVFLSFITVAWAQITVNTPVGVVTCANTLITWTGGPAQTGDSFIVQIAPANQPNGELYAGATGLRDSPYTWFVNAPVNSQVVVRILTVGRQSAESGVFTIQAGATQDCTGTSIGPSPSSTPPTPDTSSTSPNPVVDFSSTPVNPSSTSTPDSAASTSTRSIATSTGFANSTGSLSTSGSSTSQTKTIPGLPGGSSTDTGNPDPLSKSPPPIGAIVGAAVGGSAFILLLLGFCFYRRRKALANTEPAANRPHYNKAKMTESALPITTLFVPPGESVSNSHSTAPVANSQYTVLDSAHSSTAPAGSPFMPVQPVWAIPASPVSAPAPTLSPSPPPIGAAAVATSAFNHSATTSAQTHGPVGAAAAFGYADDLPPLYQDHEAARGRGDEAAQARAYDALIADFCATNRDLISPVLEQKLHAARYLPKDNPSDASAEYWHSTYGVSFFELRRLQEAYERNLATMAAINMPEKALPQAALSAKEKAMLSARRGGY